MLCSADKATAIDNVEWHVEPPGHTGSSSARSFVQHYNLPPVYITDPVIYIPETPIMVRDV